LQLQIPGKELLIFFPSWAQACVSYKAARTKAVSKRSSSNGLTCLASSSVLPSALLFYCDGVLVDTEEDGHRISFHEVLSILFD
jgi:hypothetical protein